MVSNCWSFKEQNLEKFWCWRRLLRVSWTVRRSNQSILKEINTEHALEGLRLKLKFQFFGHLMQRTDSLEKTLMLRKTESRRRRTRRWGDRRWDSWMASSTQWTWVWASFGRWWRTGKPGVLQSMGSQRVGPNWATEQQRGHGWISLVAQLVKNPAAMQETCVWWLEDLLEKGIAIHSSTLAWRIPWTEEPGGLQSTWSQSRTWLRDWH